MNLETAAALTNLYQIAAGYKSDFDLVKLSGISRSTRELTRENWSEMEGKFDMDVVLSEDNQLHQFLPRILEWLIADYAFDPKCEWLNRWDLGRRFNHANWLEWPAEEVEAVRAVLEAWTREEVARPEGKMPIDFLTEIKDDLARYLEIWLQIRAYELAQYLWTTNWQENETVRLWVISPHVEAALEAEFFLHPDGKRAQLLSHTIELIRSLRG